MVNQMKGKKPQILLHICCAPDSSAVYEQLRDNYTVIGYFHNPNIHPEEEYQKRLFEANRVADKMKIQMENSIYNPKSWFESIKGLEQEPEKGKRCEVCFLHNLRAAAKKATELDIPFFTTTLTISPHKKSSIIFSAGNTASKEFGLTFLPLDFKKKEGFKRSLILSREMSLYRQKYCGCKFSMRK